MPDNKREFDFNKIFNSYQNYEQVKNSLKEEVENNFRM